MGGDDGHRGASPGSAVGRPSSVLAGRPSAARLALRADGFGEAGLSRLPSGQACPRGRFQLLVTPPEGRRNSGDVERGHEDRLVLTQRRNRSGAGRTPHPGGGRDLSCPRKANHPAPHARRSRSRRRGQHRRPPCRCARRRTRDERRPRIRHPDGPQHAVWANPLRRKWRALYAFTRDQRGGRSRCYGACAKAWPIYFAKGRPVAGKSVRQSLIR